MEETKQKVEQEEVEQEDSKLEKTTEILCDISPESIIKAAATFETNLKNTRLF